MKKITIVQILGSAAAIFSVLPGAGLAAEHFRAYELIWLIPFAPAFTVTFFWIVIVMVGHYIKANPYGNSKSIEQSRAFLTFFNGLFFVVQGVFIVCGIVLFRYFA